MIRTFRHKGLREVFETGRCAHVAASMTKRITRQLDVLDAATSIQAVNVPGYQLHLLKGQRAGEWAIWVTGNWRITFRLDRGDIYDVNSEDYH